MKETKGKEKKQKKSEREERFEREIYIYPTIKKGQEEHEMLK